MSRTDATSLVEAYARGATTVTSVVAETFEHIARADGALGAFAVLDKSGACKRAEALDAAQQSGQALGPLHGVPVALKSNMCLEGIETHCGSRILSGYKPPYTATFVQRLIAAGAVPIGMTHMDEFAMGSSSENSAFGPVRNPWDPTRTPGGSSSGSAVSVGAGFVPLALGSDTGGSVRQPASMCGIVGYKPTYGRVSRYGLIAFGSSLDQVSPFARSVRDIELVLQTISGADENDSTCSELPPIAPFNAVKLDGLRVGVPREYFPADLAPDVRASIDAALEVLRASGAELIDIDLPNTRYAIPTYYVVATAEASANLARYDGVRYGTRSVGDGTLQGMYAATRNAGFGDEVKRRILLGTYVLSSGYYDAWYSRALKARRLIAQEFEFALQEVDVIVGPTSPTAAFKLGEREADPVAMYQSDTFTVPASLAGIPAVSIPCGTVRDGEHDLPVGLQILGRAEADAFVLGAARALEERLAFDARPQFAGGAR